VAFGNLVIANELIVILFLGPLIFLAWFYTRILKAQVVKVSYEDKTGTAWVYPARWNIDKNKVVFKRSRSETITLKKKHNPKLMNFSSVKREWWFRGKEGIKHTTAWGDQAEEKNTKIDAGYEAISMLKSMVDELRYSAIQGFKANLPWILSGMGMGVAIGMVVMMLLGGT